MKVSKLIVKHNDFIEAKYNLTLTELKIIAKLSSMIQKDDDDFKSYKFTELSKIYGSLEVIEGDSKKDVKIYSLLKQDGNDYYIEVSSKVMNYSNVSLKIRIRDYEYLYSLKES